MIWLSMAKSNTTHDKRRARGRCPRCDKKGHASTCLTCGVEHAERVSRLREKRREAGLCRCGQGKLRFGMKRCLDCLFADENCETCGRPFIVLTPWCDDHEWLRDFPAFIEELRRVAAEPVPGYMKKARDTGITKDDLPPHWKALVGAAKHSTV